MLIIQSNDAHPEPTLENPKAPKLDDEAISIAALYRAGGGFEYLGDLVLLAWHCTSDIDRKRTLAWYLENQVPSIGMYGLAKAALRCLAPRVSCALKLMKTD